jgi:hypothetical protein
MDLPALVDQREIASQRLNQLIGPVPGHGKSGAPFGPVGRERGQDDVYLWSDGAVPEVSVNPDLISGVEMEDRPVVPQVVAACRFPCQQVMSDPLHWLIGAHTLSACLQHGLGDVENGEIGEAPLQQRIDQDRRASPYIDHNGPCRDAEKVHEFKGHHRLCLVPANGVASGLHRSGTLVPRQPDLTGYARRDDHLHS